MKRSLTRALLRVTLVGAVALSFVFHTFPATARAAGTAPGTAISNTATATYTDSNNVSYTTNSNTVTTTVQNAPSLSIAGATAQNVSPGEVVTDTFTITNTGNTTGAITLNTPTQTGSATLVASGYVLNGAATGTCSVATPCSLATLNTQSALATAAVGTAITVGVQYTVSTSAAPGSTVATTLTGSVTQAAVGSVPAATSATATATDTDTVLADARLDLFKSVTAPASAGALITYTIDGNNGGSFGAQAVNSAGAFLGLGTSTPGVIAVLDQVPHFTGATVQAALNSAPLVPTLPANDTGTVYYTTATNGIGGWSATYNPAATYIALFVTTTNASGIVFPADPSGSTGAGVAQTTHQFVFTFQTTQPTGNGVSNPGSLSNIANSIIGGNPGANGTPIIAPGIAVDTDYENTTTTSYPNTTFTATAANTTPSSGTTPPGGASNTVTTQAFAQQSVTNGPLDNAGVTGSYNGTAAVSNQDDFTAVGFNCASGSSTTVVTGGVSSGAACSWPAAGVSVPNTLTNGGNGSDLFNIYATAPAGYTVTLYAATGCNATTQATLAAFGCTQGAAISATSASGGSVTTTAALTVPSGTSYNYIAVYQAATGTTSNAFAPVDFDTIAYGSAATVTGGVPTVGTDANETYDVVYPGGPLQVTKTQVLVSGCPTGVTETTGDVCPSGTITYSLAYKNVAPAALASGGSGVGTEPAFAFNGLIAGTATIVDDGTLAGSWASTTTSGGVTQAVPTFGIDASVAPVIPSGATATYTPTSTLSTGTYPSKTTGPSKISVSVPGPIQPGTSGTISFQVTVK